MRRLAAMLAAFLLASCATSPPAMRAPEGISWEMKMRAQRSKTGKRLLRDRDIRRLREIGARSGEVERLLALRAMDGAALFDGVSLAWFLENGGELDYALALASSSKPFTGYQIAELNSLGKDLPWVEAMEWLSPAAIVAYARAGGTVEYMRKVDDAIGYLRGSVNDDTVERLFEAKAAPADIAALSDLHVFNTATELTKFLEAHGSPAYADSLRQLDGRSIMRFQQLRIPATEALSFNDTSKPNALVIYPFSDYNGEYENDASLRLFRAVRSEYDVFVRIAVDEAEIAKQLEALPTVDLLWLAGHGTVSSLTFKDVDFVGGIESARLDTLDDDLAAAFSRLAPDATIFLDACDCGKPRNGLPNLAQFVQTLAPGRHVIAADYAFTHDEARIVSLVPLRLEFVRK